VASKLNRSHLHHGREALILPCLGRSERDVRAAGEQFVSVEDSMSMVHASRERMAPTSPQLRSEVAIITELGRRLFGDDLGWREMGEDYSLIRKHIEHVVPGFDAYEERVSQPGGFMLPRPPRDSRTFKAATGKGTLHRQPANRGRGARRSPRPGPGHARAPPPRPWPQPRRSWLQTLTFAANPTSWRPLCWPRLDKRGAVRATGPQLMARKVGAEAPLDPS
jgi:hypothetical protein